MAIKKRSAKKKSNRKVGKKKAGDLFCKNGKVYMFMGTGESKDKDGGDHQSWINHVDRVKSIADALSLGYNLEDLGVE